MEKVNPDLPKIVNLILNEVIIQEAQAQLRQPKRQRGVFRASELGNCPRAIQYAVLGHPRQPFGPRLSLLLRDGHLHEGAILELLRSIGTVTNEQKEVKKEYTVGADTITVIGHYDCLFNDKYIVDCKSITCNRFDRLNKDYVYREYPQYVYQIQLYMDMEEKEHGLLLFKNKNNSALKPIWYTRDEDMVQEALDKLFAIHEAGDKLIGRPYKSNSWECRGCPMRIHCWKTPLEDMNWK